MKNQSQINFCPEKITGKVRHLRKMIKNTTSENQDDLLATSRKRLTDAMARNYNPESLPSTIRWLEQVREQVNKSASDLEFVIKGTDRPLPDTVKVYGCAINLTAELGRIIRKIEKVQSERR